MSNLITPADNGSPDWNLYFAAALSIGRQSLGQKNARYKSVALEAFDAAELTNSDPRVIARLWLDNGGYTSQQPRL
jgi:hypothetical protein